ncbi:hypothetical protein EVAR_50141_1 [Eumeta japonica]|uniref:Uncharacterized protein n=1 Tax=Eumeta variegata TaxID=151549 RepID=A0A4C1SFC2_EUMVA|nr:hypothetical protein EVAR_50141_1 [Eumeta japonica]
MDGYDINKLHITTSNALPGPHTSWQNRAKSHGMRTRNEADKKWRSTHNDIPMRGVRADGCPAPLKWLSWTMADRPVVLVNGAVQQGQGPPSRRKTVKQCLKQ